MNGRFGSMIWFFGTIWRILLQNLDHRAPFANNLVACRFYTETLVTSNPASPSLVSDIRSIVFADDFCLISRPRSQAPTRQVNQ